MKQLPSFPLKWHQLPLSLLFFLVLFACEQEDAEMIKEAQVPIAEQSFEDQVAFAGANLMVLGESVLSISDDASFREVLYKEVDKKFDGDNDILFEKLLEIPITEKQTIGARIANTTKSKDMTSITQACDAFKGIGEENYYPQIFIPFYDELKESGVLGTKSPVVVVHSGDDGTEEYVGYTLDSKGELTKTSFLVDEDYAMNNEVWVISINERVDSQGLVKDNLLVKDNGIDTYEIENNSRMNFEVRGRIRDLRVKCYKESFVNGTLELIIGTATSWVGGISPNTGNIAYFKGWDDPLIPLFYKRKWVKNRDIRGSGFPYWPSQETTVRGDYCVYIIFEYDAFPAGKREAVVGPPGTGGSFDRYTFDFRSYDEEFIKGYVGASEACTISTQITGCIEVNFECY